jgi:hypothetical protein
LAACYFSLQGAAQIDDLFLHHNGRALDAVAERETGIAEAYQGLLELSGLVVRGGNARGFNDAKQHIVERVDVARDGEQFADGSGSGVGLLDKRWQVGLDVALYFPDVMTGFFAYVAAFPSVEIDGSEGLLDGGERGLKLCGESGRRGCGGIGGCLGCACERKRREDCRDGEYKCDAHEMCCPAGPVLIVTSACLVKTYPEPNDTG